jgi:hypothetical protein
MEPMKKPEWFELAENDPAMPPRNVKRGFRALALSVPLMAIGIGVVLAQTSNESPASAETASVAAAQNTTSAVESQGVSSPTKLTQAAQSSQPTIAVPPVGGGDDDEDDYEDEDEDGDDGNEEED